jgi:hypothetical protein
MRILVIKCKVHPKFIYRLFLSKDTNFSTEKLSIEEACAAEIVIVRYMYCIAFN